MGDSLVKCAGLIDQRKSQLDIYNMLSSLESARINKENVQLREITAICSHPPRPQIPLHR